MGKGKVTVMKLEDLKSHDHQLTCHMIKRSQMLNVGPGR